MSSSTDTPPSAELASAPAESREAGALVDQTAHYLDLIRFSHTVFALPFALLAAIMAWRLPSEGFGSAAFGWQQLVGILLCMATARAAAMAFNRIVDRDIDAENPRTKERHIPAGILSVAAVSGFAVACSLAFVASTLLFWPNWLPIALSLPVLAFLLGYSYTKRFTSLAHFWLGIALGLAPICTWIAIRGEVLLTNPADIVPAALLGGAVLLWVAGFDMIYACQDADFDRAAGLSSVPAWLGVAGALRLAAVCHLAMLGLLAALPFAYDQLEWLYWLGVGGLALLLLYEHWLVRPDDLSQVNVAFFHVNAVVSIGLLIVTAVDLWWL